MIRRNEIRPMLRVGLLAIGFLATTLEVTTFYEAMQLRRNFPAQVAELEQKYGKFKQNPEIEFRPLPYDKGGTHQRGNIVVNNSLLNTLLFRQYRTSTVPHELGHLVINQIINETNTRWVRKLGDLLLLTPGMEEQYETISEGCAEYISISAQNGGKLIHYERDHSFVKPVLDRYGVTDGIRTLLLNPPSREELKNPLVYYTRIGLKHN